MSAEGMVARYAPVIPGYVQRHYGHLRERHCLYDVDDLIQIAMIELIKLSKTWEPRDHNATRKQRKMFFFNELKWRVSSAIQEHRKDVEPGRYVEDSFDRTFEDSTQSVLEYRTSINLRPDSPTWPIIREAIVDQFSLLPLERKTALALRFYDELSFNQIGELLGHAPDLVGQHTRLAQGALRDFARNQFTDHAVDVHKFRNIAYEPPETLLAYVRGRHRMELNEWLGIVTLCLRSDSVYIDRMLKDGVSVVHGSYVGMVRTDLQQLVDARLASGMTVSETARELGMDYEAVWRYSRRASALD